MPRTPNQRPPNSQALTVLVFVFCLAGFIWGLVKLFQLRFETGDVYPEYSSLRADPLGTMAFWEALQKFPAVSVRRDFSEQNQLPDGKQTAYLHLAARSSEWKFLPEDLLQEIDGFLARGGRLVVTFFPEMAKPFAFLSEDAEIETRSKSSKQKSKTEKKQPAGKRPGKKQPVKEEEEGLPRRISLKERWGLEFGFDPLGTTDSGSYLPAQAQNRSDLSLPEMLDWHSALVLTNLNTAWETIYARGKHPVLVERNFGPGTVVIATDSYFLSNEAILNDRHADLLAWMIGPSRQIVFDEAHFGIVESPGVATLMRKYRLHGLFAGLLLLAGLFIWKNMASFMPPYADETEQRYTSGKDAASGFVNLLRRNVPARDLLQVCFDSWKKSFSHARKPANSRLQQATAIVEAENAKPPRDRNPIKAYHELCQLLRRP